MYLFHYPLQYNILTIVADRINTDFSHNYEILPINFYTEFHSSACKIEIINENAYNIQQSWNQISNHLALILVNCNFKCNIKSIEEYPQMIVFYFKKVLYFDDWYDTNF